MCRNAGKELMRVGAHDTGINTGIERNLYVAFQVGRNPQACRDTNLHKG